LKHFTAENGIHVRLIPATFGFGPGNHILVQTGGDLRFDGAIMLVPDSIFPVFFALLWNVAEVDITVWTRRKRREQFGLVTVSCRSLES